MKHELLKTDAGRRRVEAAARRVIQGPRDREAEPEEPEELCDEDRFDRNIPPNSASSSNDQIHDPIQDEIVYSPQGSESGDEVSDQMVMGFIAEMASEFIKYGHHVSEVYSPSRVTKLASKVNLEAGFAIDLREVDPDDGLPWDLNDVDKQNKLLYRVESEKPLLLIGSPPCTVFSQLFASNWTMMDPQQLKEKVMEGYFQCGDLSMC